MTYITNEELSELPEDPEQAFIKLESIVRGRFNEENRKSPTLIEPHRKYLDSVLPAAAYYNIGTLKNWKKPSSDQDIRSYFNAFVSDVDFFVMEMRLRAVAHQKKILCAS